MGPIRPTFFWSDPRKGNREVIRIQPDGIYFIAPDLTADEALKIVPFIVKVAAEERALRVSYEAVVSATAKQECSCGADDGRGYCISCTSKKILAK